MCEGLLPSNCNFMLYEILLNQLFPSCVHSQRGLRETITLPYEISLVTDVLPSCANSSLFPSMAPVSHPQDSGELHEYYLLRQKHHCRNNPLQPAILLPYGTPLSVYSVKTKTQCLPPKAKIISWGLFFVKNLQIFTDSRAYHTGHIIHN